MKQRSFRYRRLSVLLLVTLLPAFSFIVSVSSVLAHTSNAATTPTPTSTPPPSIAITSVTQPGSACLTQKGPIVITAKTTTFTPSSVTYFLDSTSTILGSAPAPSYTFNWTTNIPDGTHTLIAEAMFGMEQISGSTSIIIFVGCTPTPTPPPTLTPPATLTPSVTPAQPSTPTPSPSSCKIVYTINSQWGSGFGATIRITNTGTTTITSWTLQFAFLNGQTVTQGWNGQFSQSGANVTITNLSYNGTIAPGATVSSAPGFNGAWTGTNQAPASFTLNGVVCQ